ncbi:MAG: hypothetical protein E6K97_07405 [Thaumarchaeota archaeon]|nr:MAG: hypothetical protein E6K97_07405 [Nitrososphaerota archaeon]
MSDNSKSLDRTFLGGARKIVVCKADIDLSKNNDNTIFILYVEESLGSAGGRIGGAGFRKISRIVCYKTISGIEKIFETQDDDVISNFEIPLSAVAMDIELSNNSTYLSKSRSSNSSSGRTQ